jgi:N-methylhydantoinase A/oxoprolinase/acetone carboxylase beta subunit
MTVQSSCWIGIDTGGTFTDVVLADRASGSYWFRKVPSNPADPAEAILRGLDEIWPRPESAVSVNCPLPQSTCRCVKAICYAF